MTGDQVRDHEDSLNNPSISNTQYSIFGNFDILLVVAQITRLLCLRRVVGPFEIVMWAMEGILGSDFEACLIDGACENTGG